MCFAIAVVRQSQNTHSQQCLLVLQAPSKCYGCSLYIHMLSLLLGFDSMRPLEAVALSPAESCTYSQTTLLEGILLHWEHADVALLLFFPLQHREEDCKRGLQSQRLRWSTLQVYVELDDRLLQEFPAFLEERGVDADMGAYLLGLVNDKEQREYRSWLENVQKFLKK